MYHLPSPPYKIPLGWGGWGFIPSPYKLTFGVVVVGGLYVCVQSKCIHLGMYLGRHT